MTSKNGPVATVAAADAAASDSGPMKHDDAREQNRSKKMQKKKSGGGPRGSVYAPQQAEPLSLTQQQGDNVRVVKVDTRKAAAEAGEDPARVQLSRTGKAAQMILSDDRFSVTSTKGFRTARASHGAHVGTWYCEVRVSRLGPTGHVRLGWCTRKAELQAPVGFDQYGYGYRDVEGSRVHRGRREPYGEAFAEGDIVGMLLHLPPGGRPLESQDRRLVRFKGSMYYVDELEAKPEPLVGGFIAFTRNGVPQGVAYQDILEGTYYPAASLFTLPEQTDGASVTFNFGPDFAFQPPGLGGCPEPKPVAELASSISTAPVASVGGTLTAILNPQPAGGPAADAVQTPGQLTNPEPKVEQHELDGNQPGSSIPADVTKVCCGQGEEPDAAQEGQAAMAMEGVTVMEGVINPPSATQAPGKEA